jgi:hypothetical protein
VSALTDDDERPLLERIREGYTRPPRLLEGDDARIWKAPCHEDAVAVIGRLGAGDGSIDAVYAFALAHPVADYADHLVAPGRFDRATAARLRPNVRWLRRTARDAEPIKLAIVLTGMIGEARDIDDLITLAADEEFTLLAVQAIARLDGDPTDPWMAIARTATGWGLVEVVEHLTTVSVSRVADRQWLIALPAIAAEVADQLAAPAAAAGQLATTVVPTAPDAVLDGAATIVASLVRGGGEADVLSAAEAYVEAVARRCDRLLRVDAVVAARSLGGPVAVVADAILVRPDVRAIVVSAFRAGASADRALALRLAPAVALDLWADACDALRVEPDDASLAFTMLQDPSPARVQETLDVLADQPASRIADRVLDEALRRVGVGDVACDRLVGAGLLSANPRIRELAARASRP